MKTKVEKILSGVAINVLRDRTRDPFDNPPTTKESIKEATTQILELIEEAEKEREHAIIGFINGRIDKYKERMLTLAYERNKPPEGITDYPNKVVDVTANLILVNSTEKTIEDMRRYVLYCPDWVENFARPIEEILKNPYPEEEQDGK